LGGYFRGLDEFNPWVGLFICLAGVLLIQGSVEFQPFDDAFITYRYARNLSQGLGFVYNRGEQVLGTTTPLYTLLLALISIILQPEIIPGASFIIGIAADVFNVWLLFKLSREIFKDRNIALLISAVFLLHPYRLTVANGGMETSLFILSLLLTYDRYICGNRSLSTSIWSAAAFLIRPDALLALVPVYADWFFHDKKGSIRSALIALGLISPWIIWSALYFGTPIPHSIIAKDLIYNNPPGHAAYFLLTFIGTGTPGPYLSPYIILPIIVFGFPLLTISPWILLKKQPRALVISLYPILYTIVMILQNPSMIFPWYYLPLIPGLLILAAGLIWFGLKVEKKTKYLIGLGTSLILILFPLFLLVTKPTSLLSRARESAFRDACAFLAEDELEGRTVLAPDIGVIGWCLDDVKILDPIGLVSPEAIPYNKDAPPNELLPVRLLLDKKPDYLIGLDHFIGPNILENEGFQESYEMIYNQRVLITEHDHQLYIFQYRK